jgi:hypothetical protein
MAFSFGKMNDPDATLFIQVSEITGSTQRGAIVDLVKDLKSNNLWSKMKAIYPFVGGTAATHKWNLKDPRDVDAAFRLTFYGGLTHSSTGMVGNGSTGYADTNLFASSSLIQYNAHISYYCRTNNSRAQSEMGFYNGRVVNGAWHTLAVRWSGNYYMDIYTRITGTSTDAKGYYVNLRTNQTTHKAFKNGSQLGTTNTGSDITLNSTSNRSMFINAQNDSDFFYYSNQECAFATIGDGLNDAEVSTLYTIVQKYQTTLGRQV